jgi:hypothetical protein
LRAVSPFPFVGEALAGPFGAGAGVLERNHVTGPLSPFQSRRKLWSSAGW